MSENKKEKQINKKRIVSIVLVSLIVVFSFASGFMTSCLIRGENANFASELVYIMDKVGCIYDPVTGELRDITKEDIADALVNGLLDEYSAFYTAEEYQSVSANDKGNYRGFGVAFYNVNDTSVDLIVGNSPLDRAGVKIGDTLVSASVAGGEKVYFSTAYDVIDFLNACSETDEITFNCIREQKEFLVEGIKKENYIASYASYYDSEKCLRFLSDDESEPKATESVNDCIEILDERVGYIKLDSFEGEAAKHVGEALDYMKSRGRDKLVLDLRSNGGGLMTVLTDIAEYFIDNGGAKKSLVALAEGKSKNEYFYTDKNNFKDFLTDVAIIGDNNTASASECLIGAMVCYERCNISKVVVEEDEFGNAKTYGKGIMQTTYQFLSGGAFKLTTARILWPDKTTCIHNTGVTPAMGAVSAKKGQGLAVAISLFN